MVIDAIKDDKIIHFKLSKDRVIVADVKEHLSIDVRNVKEELLVYPARVSLWKTMKTLTEQKINREKIKGTCSEHLLYQYQLISDILDVMEEKGTTLFNLLERGQSVKMAKESYLKCPEVIKLQTLLSA